MESWGHRLSWGSRFGVTVSDSKSQKVLGLNSGKSSRTVLYLLGLSQD